MTQSATYGFDIGEAVSAGWRRFWPNIGAMALFAVIVWAVQAVFQAPTTQFGAAGDFLWGLLGFVLGQLIAIGWIKLALDITDGVPVRAAAITDRFRLLLPYLLAAVLYTVMVSIGLVLLIVPGIIVAIVFAFYGFHIVDTGERDPIGALRRSAEITRGNRLRLFAFGLVLLGINLVGLLLLLVGVLFTSGISLLAIAHVYRRLSTPGGHGRGVPGPEPGIQPA